MYFSDAQQLTKVFEEVYTEIFEKRFWGLPIANHQLSVKVAGLRESEDFYTFCLVTPWMLNKIVVAKKEDVDIQRVKGMRFDQLERLGEFWVANVVSPMDKFLSMEEAIKEGEKQAEQLFYEVFTEDKDQADDESRREFFRKLNPKT